jgi:chromosome segregation ATPase
MGGNASEAGSTTLQAAFTERQQELTVIESLIANTIVVTDVEKAKYELELRNYQRVPAEDVTASFGSTVEGGISPQEAALRLQRNGLNQLQPPRVRPVWLKLLLSLFGGFAPVSIS